MRPLRIGLSACFFHADPKRPIFKGKTLQYLEQSMARWVMAEGAMTYLIPLPGEDQPIALKHFAEDLDGLVLEGGSDVSPESYGEKPIRPEWGGDRLRDIYEIALVREFMTLGKPVFGVCRGLQLINVAMGGTLYQDIEHQLEGSRQHRNWEIYDQLFHAILLKPGSALARTAAKPDATKVPKVKVNSVHHQGVKELGKNLIVEAVSEADSVVEAFRYDGKSYVYAVQWHPEFQDPKDETLFDTRPVFREFLAEARQRREKGR